MKNRKVKFKKWIPREYTEKKAPGQNNIIKTTIEGTACYQKEFASEGVLLEWGVNTSFYNNEVCNQTMAIIELPNGEVTTALPENIKFVKEEIQVCTKESFEETKSSSCTLTMENGLIAEKRNLEDKNLDMTQGEFNKLPRVVEINKRLKNIEEKSLIDYSYWDNTQDPPKFIFKQVEGSKQDINKLASYVHPKTLPLELTAENGANDLLVGKFFTKRRYYPNAQLDEEHDHEGNPFYVVKTVVSLKTIKEIYSAIVKHYTK